MPIEITELQQKLCAALCAEVKVHQKNRELFFVETPFIFEDGDAYSIYIRILGAGILRLTDCGHTLMHLSYENDIDNFRKGMRGKIFDQIINGMAIGEEDGEFYIDSSFDSLAQNLFRFGEAITKIHDLTFLNKPRAEATFYEDLWHDLTHIVDPKIIHKDYIYQNIPNAAEYPIDYYIEAKKYPLYLFGIPSKNKALLTTIVLQRLLRANAKFDSLLIFKDQSTIERADLARLSDAGGEMVSSLDAQEDLKRKILRKLEA